MGEQAVVSKDVWSLGCGNLLPLVCCVPIHSPPVRAPACGSSCFWAGVEYGEGAPSDSERPGMLWATRQDR